MNPKLCFLCGSSHHLFSKEVMHNLQPSFGGGCTQSELQGMKGKDRKQPWLSARISWENILQPPPLPPRPTPPPPLPAPPPSQQLWDEEGLSSCTPRGEREDGNATEMGVVLHGMKPTALHHTNREYDTQPTRLQSIFSICHSRTPVLMLECRWSQIKQECHLLKIL